MIKVIIFLVFLACPSQAQAYEAIVKKVGDGSYSLLAAPSATFSVMLLNRSSRFMFVSTNDFSNR